MFDREGEIVRERFVDHDTTVLSFAQARPGAIDLIGCDVIENFTADMFRYGEAMLVKGLPCFGAKMFDHVRDFAAVPTFRKLPHIHRLMERDDVRQRVQQRTDQRRSGPRRSSNQHIAHVLIIPRAAQNAPPHRQNKNDPRRRRVIDRLLFDVSLPDTLWT